MAGIEESAKVEALASAIKATWQTDRTFGLAPHVPDAEHHRMARRYLSNLQSQGHDIVRRES